MQTELTESLWRDILGLDNKKITRFALSDEFNIGDYLARCLTFVLQHENIIRFPRHQSDSRDILVEDNGESKYIQISSSDIRTLEELLQYSNVDLKEWEVTKHVVNTWGKQSNSNFQVKAWLKKRFKDFNINEFLKEFEERATIHAPSYPKVEIIKDKECLLEISIPDFHFGQLSWGKETEGTNYDIKIAKKLFIDTINYFLESIQGFDVGQILFPVGNDFFNTNSKLNETVNGTKQDEDGRWKKTFDEGLELVIAGIDFLREKARVDVLIIPGNHDEERIYYLGAALKAWYRNCNNVNIDNSPTMRKYYLFGKCLLGFTHSDKEKISKNSLPMIMAGERKEWWGQTKYREWHIGHKHHADETQTKVVKEDDGVRVVMIPSLAAIDAWHAEKGFHAIREAKCFIWEKNKGCIASLNYHP
jgi:hypothetical protein